MFRLFKFILNTIKSPNPTLYIHGAATTNHGLVVTIRHNQCSGDVIIGGKLEVDGDIYV